MLSNINMMDLKVICEQIVFNLRIQPTITHSDASMNNPKAMVTSTFYDYSIPHNMLNLAMQPLTMNYNTNNTVNGFMANSSDNRGINQFMQQPTVRTTTFNYNIEPTVKRCSGNLFDENGVNKFMQPSTTMGHTAGSNRNVKTTAKSSFSNSTEKKKGNNNKTTQPPTVENNSTDNKMFEVFQKLKKQSDTHHEDLLKAIKQQADNLQIESEHHLGEFELKIDSKVESGFAKHADILKRLEDNKRIAQLNEVIVRGIPYKQNEKLLKIFDALALAIGFGHSIYTSLNRIYRMSFNQSDDGAPILVQFSTYILKHEFMTYFFKKPLQLKDIGSALRYPFKNRFICVYDNLTPLNHSIYLKAVELLKQKKIFKHRTMNGFVYVKYRRSGKWQKINHPDNLQGVMKTDT